MVLSITFVVEYAAVAHFTPNRYCSRLYGVPLQTTLVMVLIKMHHQCPSTTVTHIVTFVTLQQSSPSSETVALATSPICATTCIILSARGPIESTRSVSLTPLSSPARAHLLRWCWSWCSFEIYSYLCPDALHLEEVKLECVMYL